MSGYDAERTLRATGRFLGVDDATLARWDVAEWLPVDDALGDPYALLNDAVAALVRGDYHAAVTDAGFALLRRVECLLGAPDTWRRTPAVNGSVAAWVLRNAIREAIVAEVVR